jgi:hypothetical protein
MKFKLSFVIPCAIGLFMGFFMKPFWAVMVMCIVVSILGGLAEAYINDLF